MMNPKDDTPPTEVGNPEESTPPTGKSYEEIAKWLVIDRHEVQFANDATFWLIEFRDNIVIDKVLQQSGIGWGLDKSKAILCGKNLYERASGQIYRWVPRSYKLQKEDLDRVIKQCEKHPKRFGGKLNTETLMSEDCKSF